MEKKMSIRTGKASVILQDRKRLPCRFHPIASGTIRHRTA
jgi:hypothetical protein